MIFGGGTCDKDDVILDLQKQLEATRRYADEQIRKRYEAILQREKLEKEVAHLKRTVERLELDLLVVNGKLEAECEQMYNIPHGQIDPAAGCPPQTDEDDDPSLHM